jgi:RNA polymerase sigma factor (TIGR02999 family)
MSDVTRILSQIESVGFSTAEQLLPLVYDELRKLAATRLAYERPGQSFQATALVHEVYLRLVGCESLPKGYATRLHFVQAAAQVMRRVLIERARARNSLKRGGDYERIELNDVAVAATSRPYELLALDAALDGLAEVEPQAARLVQFRYFGGCTMEEAAELLELSLRSTHRLWAYARAWLLEELARE